jgi:transcriptional regulator with XRE-family HTH domain
VGSWERNEAVPGIDAVISLGEALGVPASSFLPPDPVSLQPPGWETVARRLGLTYEDAVGLRAILQGRGIAETATTEEALLVWMRERRVLP